MLLMAMVDLANTSKEELLEALAENKLEVAALHSDEQMQVLSAIVGGGNDMAQLLQNVAGVRMAVQLDATAMAADVRHVKLELSYPKATEKPVHFITGLSALQSIGSLWLPTTVANNSDTDKWIIAMNCYSVEDNARIGNHILQALQKETHGRGGIQQDQLTLRITSRENQR